MANNNIRKFVRQAGYYNGLRSVASAIEKKAALNKQAEGLGWEHLASGAAGAGLGMGGLLLAQKLMDGGGTKQEVAGEMTSGAGQDYAPEEVLEVDPEQYYALMQMYQNNPYAFQA